jgi:hypothetical protein
VGIALKRYRIREKKHNFNPTPARNVHARPTPFFLTPWNLYLLKKEEPVKDPGIFSAHLFPENL